MMVLDFRGSCVARIQDSSSNPIPLSSYDGAGLGGHVRYHLHLKNNPNNMIWP